MAFGINALEQQYKYGQYGQGGNAIPFGGLTVQPRITTPVVEPTTGIHMPKVTSAVDDGQGNMIAYANNGYVGAMGKTDGIATQAGYEEKAGFKPKLNMLYA